MEKTMRIKELRQRKADLLTEAETLTAKEDDGSIIEEETARLNALTDDEGEITKVNASIKREERLMDERRSMIPVTDLNEDTKKEAGDKLPAEAKKKAETFESFGEQMMAVANKAINGVEDSRLPQLWAASGASEGVAGDGGYLVQTDFSTELLRKTYDTGVFSRRVRRIPVNATSNGLKINAIKETSRADGSRFGGVEAFWAGEAAAFSGSKPTFRQMELGLHKLTGLAYATDELLADATALGAVLNTAFQEEFGFKIDNAIFEGNGAGIPKGIMNGAALVSVAKESGQGADTVLAANIHNIWSRMWGRSRSNAIWFINQDVEPQLYGMVIGDKPVFIPAGTIATQPFATLMGRPVVETEHNDTLGDKGDILFADLSQYLWIDKGSIKSDSSIHVRFLNDEMTFRFILRADGQPIWESALTPFKGTATKSPYVTLDARA
jgi:HK97 family phage major capsid protein